MNPRRATDHDRVGPYQIVKAIGAGGSARIDLARVDRAYGFQRHVVIKRPLEHLRADAKAAASLRREANIGARLRHPNLVAILDAGEHDGYDYLVLEYVHGGSLRTLVQADQPSRVRDCPLGAALALVGDVARGLHAAHELADDAGHPLGLVHRDVSPGNILVGLDGAVKLADFGIAKETRVQTLSGSMHGTVTYMAPEQCRGHAFDRRADVFSLGVILYELLTGTRLFWADNDVASLHRVLSGHVPRPRKVRPSIAPALEDIVMTAVAHEQDKRFATARDLADALEIHAAEAGAILGARRIARWVHDVLGPREVPWIGAPTVIDLPAAAPPADADADASLVALIESMQLAEEPPPDPTFGPTTPSFSDEIDTAPRRPPARPHKKRLAAVIALGLAGGAGATAFVMTRGSSTTPARTPTTDPAAPAGTPDRPVIDPAVNVEPARESDAVEADMVDTHEPSAELPARVRPPSRKRRDRSKGNPPVAGPASPGDGAGSAAPPPPPGAGSASASSAPPSAGSATASSNPGAGSGSAVRPARNPKVEWNPTMLLPTDSGSGTKKP